MTLPTVFRAVQILTTAAGQLSLNVERGGRIAKRTPALIRRPDVDRPRSEWIEHVIVCLVLTGNAYLFKERDPQGAVFNLPILNPNHVRPEVDDRTGRRYYWYDGRRYSSRDIEHIRFQTLPGRVSGLGPIQAAQAVMRTDLDMDDYMSRHFTESGQPSGILTTPADIPPDELRQYRNVWNGYEPDGSQPDSPADNPSGIKVLSNDLKYTQLLLSPRDAMWIDAQQFTTVELARLFGVPSSLMLVTLDGNSQTYANVEQDWLAFVRFTLMGYLRKIEDALTDISPNGQTVRFNVETLLRSDTTTRYKSYATAIESGFLTVDEVREIEGRPPLTPEQKHELAGVESND